MAQHVKSGTQVQIHTVPNMKKFSISDFARYVNIIVTGMVTCKGFRWPGQVARKERHIK